MAVAPVINYIYSSNFNAAREFNLKQNTLESLIPNEPRDSLLPRSRSRYLIKTHRMDLKSRMILFFEWVAEENLSSWYFILVGNLSSFVSNGK